MLPKDALSIASIGIGSRTDASETDGCGGWTIFVLDPGVRVHVHPFGYIRSGHIPSQQGDQGK